MLLFLCAHGAKHGWRDLRLSADVARFIQVRSELDWDLLIGTSRDAGGERILTLGLWMANRLIGVDYPARVTEFVRRAMDGQTFAPRLAENALTKSPDQDQTLSDFRLQFRLADGWRPKLRCAMGFALLPTEADAESVALPPALYFLYYPYRPLRLAVKYGAKLFSRHD